MFAARPLPPNRLPAGLGERAIRITSTKTTTIKG